jgi:ribosomal protein S18 acetylase RimI-like enzyme
MKAKKSGVLSYRSVELSKQNIKWIKSIFDACLIFPMGNLFYKTILPRDCVICGFLVCGEESLTFDRIVGVVCGCRGTDSTKIYISGIAVKPQFRGKGLGSTILGYFKNEAKELGFEVIDLHAVENDELIRFYENNGFVRKEIVQKYYNSTENAVKMSCENI